MWLLNLKLHFFFIFDKLSLCCPGWPEILYVDQAGQPMNYGDPLVSASHKLILKSRTTMPNFPILLGLLT